MCLVHTCTYSTDECLALAPVHGVGVPVSYNTVLSRGSKRIAIDSTHAYALLQPPNIL